MKRLVYLFLIFGLFGLGLGSCSSKKETTKPKPFEVTAQNTAYIDSEVLYNLVGKEIWNTAEMKTLMRSYSKSKGYTALFIKQDMHEKIKQLDLKDFTQELASFINTNRIDSRKVE
ncbi:MAG: hypothetical protein NZ551_02510 [Microscillaceae bacterium]|nr:hypothetical protein [Microscillaceae bacterium]MDW8460058.1 hypothetical protein [Cytophagales bacterium]